MSPLEVLQLVGHSIGAVLPLWMGFLLASRRRKLTPLERVLLALALCMFGWHGSNLLITLHGLLGLDVSRWANVLKLADSVAVVSIVLTYSFLLHIHLHLWANSARRSLTFTEKIRLYLSYLPLVGLPLALYKIWTRPYAPMLERLEFLVLPMAAWIAYVLAVIAITELLIARKSTNVSEQRIMRTLAASFIAIGVVILAALALGVGEGTQLGLYLKTLANLGSLLPSALLAYYIYRYRYLELIIEESLIVATFAAVVLAVYLYGIRTIGDWMTSRYGIRSGVIEALLILGLALGAAPLRSWLQKRFHRLFQREAALYRQIVSRISTHAGQYKQLPELLDFVETETTKALALRRTRIVVSSRQPANDTEQNGAGQQFTILGPDAWINKILNLSNRNDWGPVEDNSLLELHGYTIAYPLRRDEKISGVMLVDSPAGSLTQDSRSVLEVLAGQVAIAIEDCRLVEENVQLERRLADRERLAALGQMAATVAHEIKNPLSAIKSIAQVMGEDEAISREYARDLSLIVGETDRLGQSVTQLLSFARKETPAELPQRVHQLLPSIVELFMKSAQGQGIKLVTNLGPDSELNGTAVSAVRVALSNLVLNALQVTPEGGTITITQSLDEKDLIIFIQDSGPGVPDHLRKQIWEPFFTTKQRGTGLGLAIVKKRVEEAGGQARLSSETNGVGAKFELRVPI